MKRITYICAILLSSVLMFSCSDYLEAPPSVDLDEDGVFACLLYTSDAADE